MMGRTHALTGTLGAIGISFYVPLSIPEALTAVVITTGAALLPDIDHPNSTVSKSLGPITVAFCWLMTLVSGGHRRGTHSIAGILALGAVAQAGVMYRNTGAGQVALCTTMILAIAGAVRLLRIPGWLDDLAPIPIVIALVCLTRVPLDIVPAALILGCAIHVLGDIITLTGCPIWWPFSDERVKLGLFKTNGIAERLVVTPVVIVGIVGMVAWEVFSGTH
jgi:membrane-bound metal-dependent hydrolase YbcI (DUF457 family)